MIKKREKRIICYEKPLLLFAENGIFSPNSNYTTNVAWKDKHKISHFNWSIAYKDEVSAALMSGVYLQDVWLEDMIKPSAKLVRSELQKNTKKYLGSNSSLQIKNQTICQSDSIILTRQIQFCKKKCHYFIK